MKGEGLCHCKLEHQKKHWVKLFPSFKAYKQAAGLSPCFQSGARLWKVWRVLTGNSWLVSYYTHPASTPLHLHKTHCPESRARRKKILFIGVSGSHLGSCISQRNTTDVVELHLINAHPTELVNRLPHSCAETITGYFYCCTLFLSLNWSKIKLLQKKNPLWNSSSSTGKTEFVFALTDSLCWDLVVLHLHIMQRVGLCVFAHDMRIWKIADHRSSP